MSYRVLSVFPMVFAGFFRLLMAQPAAGIETGLFQSVPLANRDSFQGSPGVYSRVKVCLPWNDMFIRAGLSYKLVHQSNRQDAVSYRWQTLGLNYGVEWKIKSMSGTFLYTGFQSDYLLYYGKSVLSGVSTSGKTMLRQDPKIQWANALEAGLVFQPKPMVRLNLSVTVPFDQASGGMQRFPGGAQIGLEYRINRHDIQKIQADTFSQEKAFARGMRNGVLVFIESGSDSARKLFREMVGKYYSYGKTDFISQDRLVSILDSVAGTPDSAGIFFARYGSIVYSRTMAATYGLIVYDHRMEDPLSSGAFFIRNNTGDIEFEDPAVVKKMVKTLNGRMYKLYNLYGRK